MAHSRHHSLKSHCRQGAWNSYAGIMTMIYYDASTGEIHSMNAGYNTILAEDDPLTIPDKASGRTVLVPGYMAGVQAAHDRFGRLPFDQLFVPAIYFAKDGFELTSLNESMMNARTDVLSRLPTTKKLYTDKSTGKFFQKDQLFKQPGTCHNAGKRIKTRRILHVYRRLGPNTCQGCPGGWR